MVAAVFVAAAFALGIGWLDYLTGDFALTVLYLPAVIFATWYAGRANGFMIALLSATVWLVSGLMLHPADTRTLQPYWNAAMVAAVYGVVVQLLFSLQRLQMELGDRVLERTASLLQANTELKAAHRHLIAAKALAERQEKLASLGVLAAGVAHEIRNPLTALKSRAFTLRKRLAPDTPALEDAEIIDQEIDRLDHIVGDFLLFARPGEPHLVPVAPHALMGKVRELLGPELAQNKIEITVESGVDDLTFRADPHQLEQVLINLVRNAAESIGQSGRITLRARQDHLPLDRAPQPVIVIEVQDTGAGIPVEVQERLFDPFFTTKPAGTGLGLSIALRIIERHGGTLQFQTAPRRGTTFGVVLPSPPAETAAIGGMASQETAQRDT